jgi:serine protease Do
MIISGVTAASIISVMIVLSFFTLGCQTAYVPPGGDPTKVAYNKTAVDKAVSKVFPALVRIYVVTKSHSAGRDQKFQAAGSGAIISPDGYVVTNHHVVGKAKWIRCTLATKDEADAELIGTDALADMGESKMKLDGENVGAIVRWIGHDAAIYGGNSGGPLVDLNGRIVGVNEIGIGLSGAIPSNLARVVAAKLKKHGEVRRSWIGAEARPLLRSSGLDNGVLVNGVTDGSPAKKAGLKTGDVILEYDGQPVRVRWNEEMPSFNRMVLETPIGKTIKLTILRGNAKITLDITTKARGKARGEDEEIREWGAAFRDITPLAARELKRDSNDGVLVTSIRPGGPCGQAKPGINSHDIIISVGKKPVRNVAELRSVTMEIARGKTEPIPTVVCFDRKTKRLFTVVKIGPSEKVSHAIEARKAWFPAAVQVFTRELADAMGLEGKKGVLITQIFPNAAAEKAGFEVGDIITHVDGMLIEASDPADARVFPAMIRMYDIGSEVEMTVIRKGTTLKITVELVKNPISVTEMKKYKDEFFEFSAREVAYSDRTREKWAEAQGGLYIEAVERAGWAALAHVAVGDLLLSINGKAVNSLDDIKSIMKKIEREKPKHVVFFVKRGIHMLYLEIEPDWKQLK